MQLETDDSGTEMTADQLWKLLLREYGYNGGVRRYSLEHTADGDQLFVAIDRDGREVTAAASASGPVEALSKILTEQGSAVEVVSLTQHSLPRNPNSSGSANSAVTIAECVVNAEGRWGGIAVHQSVTASALHAVYAASTNTVMQLT